MLKSSVISIICGVIISTASPGLYATPGDDKAERLIVTNRIYLGTIYGSAKQEFLWRPTIPAAGRIDFISRTCGCTSIDLKIGDMLEQNSEVKWSLTPAGKPAGSNAVTAVIDLGPKYRILLHLDFFYVPKPKVEPNQLIFWPGSTHKVVTIGFGGSEGISLVDIGAPKGISVEKKMANFGIELICDAKIASTTQTRGVISFRIVGGETTRFEIPYIILPNAP